MLPLDLHWRLRLAAFRALDRLRRAGGGLVTGGQLTDGFEFEGERVPFFNLRMGIWKPRQADSALTIVTAPPKPGKRPPVKRRPIIYLYGIAPNLYEAIFPCYVVEDHPDELGFHVAADVAGVRIGPDVSDQLPLAAPRRQYATATVKVRLHQRRFRELVVSAYGSRCAICRLRHVELLDASHILPDRDERGRPEVPNGLSLCKIHHAAYDNDGLGVHPDHMVHPSL